MSLAFLLVSDCQKVLAFLGLETHHSNIYPIVTWLSCSVSPCLSFLVLIKIPVTRSGLTLKQYDLILTSLHLQRVFPNQTPFPSRQCKI